MRFKKTEKNTSNKAAVTVSGRSIIGVDIGQSNIRMVQISGRQLSQIQLEKYATVALPPNVVSGNEIMDFDQLVSHLQQCLDKLKTNCKQANVALPMGAVTIDENLVYPLDDDNDLSLPEFVEAAVAQVGDLDEINYDWTVLSESDREQNILMVAARKDAVESRSDLLEEVGLTAVNVDVDLFAIANAFAFVDMQEDGEFTHERVALFDVGDITLKALIIQSGKILYKQESNFGLEQLMQLVQRTYQLSDSDAYAMISGESLQPSDYRTTILDSFNMQIAQEVQRAMQFFYATQNMDSNSDVKHIFISGSGCVANSGVAEVIRSQTNIPTQQLNPVSLIANKTKSDDSELAKNASSLTTAFGLALRGLV